MNEEICECGHSRLHHSTIGVNKRKTSGNFMGKGYDKRYEGKIMCDVKWCQCKGFKIEEKERLKKIIGKYLLETSEEKQDESS
jgi:hypothetical protein